MSDELERLRAEVESLKWQRDDIQKSLEARLSVVNRYRSEKIGLQDRINQVIELCHRAITANAHAELNDLRQQSLLMPDFVLSILIDDKKSVTPTS